jgi:colanic acid/amylovoran biosynthesis glycosyltransferase
LHFGFATQTLGSEFVAKAIGAKMGVSFRGFDIAIYPLKHPGCYKKLWNQLDKVHTISKDLLERAYELGLTRTVEVQKITPAIDVNVFTPKLSQPDSPTVRFLTVARMHWKKGLVDTLQALTIFKQLGVPFTYTIVGDGSTKEWERVAIARRDFSLENEVILAGKRNKEQVVQHYKNSDVYLQYSISEGFCNAVLEAQASKLLCVVSDAEGLSENVLHETTGWVVPKCTPELLAQQLAMMVNMSDSEKEIIRNAARSRVEEHFNIEKQQAEFVQFYTT